MKRIFTLIFMLFCILAYSSEIDMMVIKKLEDKCEYSLAAEMLIESLTTSATANDYRNLLLFSQRTLYKLSSEISRDKVSLFVPPNKKGIWERTKENGKTAGVLVVVDYFLTGGSLTALHQWWMNKEATDAQREAVRKLENPLLGKDKILSVLEGYDSIKIVVMCVEKQCKAAIKNNSSDFEEIMQILNDARRIKKELKRDRNAFLSYNVVSPYLFETERLFFLADSDYFALHGRDKETLDKAVSILATACHKEWLFQVNEDVRQQFIHVQTMLKQLAKKVELEDYKVVTTLSDSNDPSKARGADRWWK